MAIGWKLNKWGELVDHGHDWGNHTSKERTKLPTKSGVGIIPEGTTEIGYAGMDMGFYDCTDLKSITIPNSVKKIGENAFFACTGLTSITIPNSVTEIGKWAFKDCTSLTSITIGNSVKKIGEGAFSRCTGLTSITIPNSVKKIGSCTFRNCTGLTSINIPDSVKNIGEGAFSRCTGLTSIVVSKGNKVYDSRNDCNAIVRTVTISNVRKVNRSNFGIVNCLFHYVKRLIDYLCGRTEKSVCLLSDELIAGCKNTNIPDSVKKIGSYAFSDCDGLTSINIPEKSVQRIKDLLRNKRLKSLCRIA